MGKSVAALFVAALLMGACAGTGNSNAASSSLGAQVAATFPDDSGGDAAAAGLLYVAQAGAASTTGNGGEFQVTLSEVDATVLWFQDRPGRAAGDMRMSEFVGSWVDVGFASDPPNAVIRQSASTGSGHPEDASDLGVVIEMSDPVWDQPNATLRFTAHAAPGAGKLPETMKDVSLFIDDSGSSHEPVRIEASNLQPGQTLQLALDPGSGWSWSSGDADTGDGGVAVNATSGDVPLEALRITDTEIVFKTSSGMGGGTIGFTLDLFLAVGTTPTFEVSSRSDQGVEITLSVGDTAPQIVNETATTFSAAGN